MQTYLITGCNGQLGRALNDILKDREDVKIINTDVDTLNICDPDAVMAFIQEQKPDVIINCAAHTAVDRCETDEENAHNINANGPKYLAMAAAACGADIVQVSTDYIFDGESKEPYIEGDTPGPQSVYGRTKLAGEQAVAEAAAHHYIVRTAWLYGEGGNFVRTMLRLAGERDKITVVNDQFGSPTSAMELARAILFIVENDKCDYGIYHATCEGYTSWYQFACTIFEKAGVNVKVEPVTSEEYKAAAKRPKYSKLENAALKRAGYTMKAWEDALDEYLSKESDLK